MMLETITDISSAVEKHTRIFIIVLAIECHMLPQQAGIVWKLMDGTIEERLVQGVIPSIPIVFMDSIE